MTSAIDWALKAIIYLSIYLVTFSLLLKTATYFQSTIPARNRHLMKEFSTAQTHQEKKQIATFSRLLAQFKWHLGVKEFSTTETKQSKNKLPLSIKLQLEDILNNRNTTRNIFHGQAIKKGFQNQGHVKQTLTEHACLVVEITQR